jgi:hypothetical protein
MKKRRERENREEGETTTTEELKKSEHKLYVCEVSRRSHWSEAHLSIVFCIHTLRQKLLISSILCVDKFHVIFLSLCAKHKDSGTHYLVTALRRVSLHAADPGFLTGA